MKILIQDVNEPFKVDFINALNKRASVHSVIFKPITQLLKSNQENKIYSKLYNIYFLPKYYSNFISKIFLHWQLKRMINKIKPDVLIITSPFYKDLLKFDVKLKIYFAFDNYKFYKYWKEDLVLKFEQEVSQKVDLIFTSSFELRNYFIEQYNVTNEKVLHIPNATTEKFINARPSNLNTVSKLPKPIVGCIGAIDDKRLDLELIKDLVTEYPDVTFVFVGNITESVSKSEYKKIFESKNVFLTGRLTREKIPDYLITFDACILPLQINEFNFYISPVRIFDYIASGKPIISTNIPEVKYLFGYLVKVTATKEEFLKEFNLLYKNNFIDNKNTMRLKIAAEHTWISRTDYIMKLLEKKLMEKT
ncbi:MAG: glycosyltransferase [Ignavibacterium album]|uniref:glycosyltransferase n=1 Tax=Ignavibacterium album TaxID=591197 RepID=UPI0026F179FF|nr:glycosyltransferase [Ignavibacterium album]MCX8104707.1 glycosyltransferase [Ignavibacterium album]